MHEVEMYYNAVPARSTGESPHFIVYGKELPLPVDRAIDSNIPAVTAEIANFSDIWTKVKKAIEISQ